MRARLIRSLLRVFAALPLPLAHAIGAVIGAGLMLVPNDLRRISRINTPLCLPELTRAEQRTLLRRSLVEAGKTMCEAGALWLWPRARLLSLVRAGSGEEHVRAALQQGHGRILATPHLGAWEMMGLYSSARYPLTSLYRPPRMREMDALERRGRERLGARLVPVGAGGVRALYQTLARGEVIGMLPDQEPGAGNGLFAPLFGIEANTMALLPRLAIKTGARVMNEGVEALVRRCPQQYQWGYKRFRTRPAGEKPLY